jgi:hypothetical protein
MGGVFQLTRFSVLVLTCGRTDSDLHGEQAASMSAIWSIIGTVFLQSLGFTIILPSLWFYLKSVSASFLSVCVPN